MWVYILVALFLISLFFLALKVTLGAGRYGRELDHSMRHMETRAVDCPETDSPAAIVAQGNAEDGYRVMDCSHWTEHEQCDHQQCVKQIERTPHGCLVRAIMTEWFQGNACGLCGKKIGSVNWLDFKPALMTRDGTIAEWHEVPVEVLSKVLTTHSPVCRECYARQG